MFQCAAEPGWVFVPSAEAIARDYHVFLFAADGHDEMDTTVSRNICSGRSGETIQTVLGAL